MIGIKEKLAPKVNPNQPHARCANTISMPIYIRDLDDALATGTFPNAPSPFLLSNQYCLNCRFENISKVVVSLNYRKSLLLFS